MRNAKSRTGRPPSGLRKKKSTSIYLLHGPEAERKCTSVYFDALSDEAYLYLKRRPGGFSLSHFVNFALQEEAKACGWKSEELAALDHLKNRRGGFILSSFINQAVQEHAKALGWTPSASV